MPARAPTVTSCPVTRSDVLRVLVGVHRADGPSRPSGPWRSYGARFPQYGGPILSLLVEPREQKEGRVRGDEAGGAAARESLTAVIPSSAGRAFCLRYAPKW
ncbi:hypothetical protein GCM10023191_043380 [Actinoallomurus oryzae]|uniref:Uncharacterized protein n=1 Tax=Actinoallomurus oryzae TaxID=502180 RepID=A0ABP8Q8U6_9ACTN